MTHDAVLSLSDAQLRDFVGDLYRIFLKRAPDEAGLAGHLGQARGAVPLSAVVDAFANAPEYTARLREMLRRELSDPSRAPEADCAASEAFPADYVPPGEAGRCYGERLRAGFFHRYCSGPLILDVGFSGYDNPEGKAALPHAIGIDLDYPGYDGIRLPFADGSVDTVFSSHCLEHILFDHAAIRDWFRVLKVGGFIVCMVPSQALYEKKRFLPSRWNGDHKRMYTPSSLAAAFETALPVNGYRIRHLAENDRGFNYSLGPDIHSDGAYEIEIVLEKIAPPAWSLD